MPATRGGRAAVMLHYYVSLEAHNHDARYKTRKRFKCSEDGLHHHIGLD